MLLIFKKFCFFIPATFALNFFSSIVVLFYNLGKGRFPRQQVQLPETNEHSDPNAVFQKFQALKNLDPHKFPFIPMESVRVATNDFSDSNKLGQGGFGPVYKVIAYTYE